MTTKTFARSAMALAIALSVGSAHAASLTIFHNNDGESKLVSSTGFGGVSFFKATLDGLRTAKAGRDQLTLSSGDNFLAGLAFTASLSSGPLGGRDYYDAIALAEIGYDAITLGNHDFDFGPDVLADFITYYDNYATTNGLNSAPFLSANLDFSAEANLQSLVNSGNIAKSSIINKGGNTYGVIGVTTETLPSVSNPGAVAVNEVINVIQTEVTNLQNQGVNKIILSSHLQSIGNELNVISQIRGVDVVIAGGGDDLLLNSSNARNDVSQASGPYPVIAQDADGRNVAVVTTTGGYIYIGSLDVEFDANGDVVNVSGDPVVVDQSAVTADPTIEANVIAPYQAAVAAAQAQQVATTEVFLEYSEGGTNGDRVIRQRETNLGNLVADAFVFAVQTEGAGLTQGNTLIGLTNTGGIREDLDNNEDGIITLGEAIDVLPFNNTMAVVQNVTVAGLVTALENAVSSVETDSGRFAAISGFEFTYSDDLAPGSRLLEVRLDDGTLVWSREDGAVFGGLFDIATNSFLVRAGTPDGYTLNAFDFEVLGTLYADALVAYLTSPNGLGGVVTAAQYGSLEGRIVNQPVPVPAAAWMLGGALAALSRFRRRAA
jgi:5'-nucleotidase / UDP-sugar diphosphatase